MYPIPERTSLRVVHFLMATLVYFLIAIFILMPPNPERSPHPAADESRTFLKILQILLKFALFGLLRCKISITSKLFLNPLATIRA